MLTISKNKGKNMNRLFWVLAVSIVCGISCQSAPASFASSDEKGTSLNATGRGTSDVTGEDTVSDIFEKEWKLIDVRINNNSINFDRNTLAVERLGEVYTLTLGSERLSGIGAPNRFFAPYTLGNNQAISVGNVAGTLMAAFREPDKLREHEYFVYISNAYKWNLVNNRLELSSKGEDGSDVVLVFAL